MFVRDIVVRNTTELERLGDDARRPVRILPPEHIRQETIDIERPWNCSSEANCFRPLEILSFETQQNCPTQNIVTRNELNRRPTLANDDPSDPFYLTALHAPEAQDATPFVNIRRQLGKILSIT